MMESISSGDFFSGFVSVFNAIKDAVVSVFLASVQAFNDLPAPLHYFLMVMFLIITIMLIIFCIKNRYEYLRVFT